uniref:RAB42, member RAS oncogene family n=1 Tax=Dromaius novaehollandiae TaxID=8790 RepID=A0A8C4IW95_DRONO
MPAGHYQYRVLVLGDAAVGKSSLLRCYAEGPGAAGAPAPCPTVGVEFYSRTVRLPPAGRAKLQLWDTAGQERFRSITRSFYRSAAGALLVFDVTNRASFEHVTEWYQEAAGGGATGEAAFVLVGHKCDLAGERAVSAEEAGRLAASLGMAFVETSAASNLNVELALQTGLLGPSEAWDGVKSSLPLPPALTLQVPEEEEKHKRCSC